MATVKIEYTFDYFEDRKQFKNLVNAENAQDLLYEIDQDIRAKLKYGDCAWLEGEASLYLEHLREQIAESGVLNEY